MKKIYLFFIAIALLVVYVIYSSLNLPLDVQVKSVEPIKPPIDGEWIVNSYVLTNDIELSKEDQAKYLRKTAHFSKEFILFDEEVCNDPSYKLKRVDASSYFWEAFKIKPSNIGIMEKYIYIITTSSNGIHFDDYIKINDNLIIKQVAGALLFFNRIGENDSSTEGYAHESIDYKQIANEKEKETRSKSGLLLALKHKKATRVNSEDSYTYRTFWISYVEGKFLPVVEIQDILLPRMNGFWKLGVDENLWAYAVKNDINSTKKETTNFKTSEDTSILFVGHDYVSIEDKNKKLQVLPIDNLSGETIKLSKVYGQESNNSLLKEMGTFSTNSNKALSLNDTNWAIMRRAGRWILRGRTFEGESTYKDFDITYAAPKSLIKYDNLYPSFNNIKLAIPEAVDAYSSPNRDFAVVLTDKELLIVQILEGKLGKINSRIRLNHDETPVMAHWATGSYVDEWSQKAK